MSQIDELKKLYVQTREYKIPKEPRAGAEQATIKITPLSMEEFSAFDFKEGKPLSEMTETVKKLISKSLGISEEEVEKISFEYLMELFTAIMDANNFSEEDMKKAGIEDFLEKKRAQIKEQGKNGESSQ